MKNKILKMFLSFCIVLIFVITVFSVHISAAVGDQTDLICPMCNVHSLYVKDYTYLDEKYHTEHLICYGQSTGACEDGFSSRDVKHTLNNGVCIDCGHDFNTGTETEKETDTSVLDAKIVDSDLSLNLDFLGITFMLVLVMIVIVFFGEKKTK